MSILDILKTLIYGIVNYFANFTQHLFLIVYYYTKTYSIIFFYYF